ncbi:hypothetical protein [Actinopolymorpha sp. B9G3]|uniref:hypothetical protein n=1 Tax=Actinopolymorpha sp. B9G3 TaxID=3158970 RepID=UPI0032D99E87
MSKKVIVAAAAAGLIVLAGCGGGGAPAVVEGGPAKATTQMPATPKPTPKPAKTVQVEGAKQYVEAVASMDPEQLEAARKFTVPGSVADAYLLEQSHQATASLDGGSDATGLGNVTKKDDGYQFCTYDDNGDDVCFLYAGFKQQGGKLTDLSINSDPVGPRLTMGNGKTVTSHDVKFELLSAFKSSQGYLIVSVRVTTGDRKVDPYQYTATYRAPSGAQRGASTGGGPDSIAPKSHAVVTMWFRGVDVGGAVTLSFEPENDDFNTYDVKIPVGAVG